MREQFTRKDFLDALFGDYFKRRDGFLIVKSVKHLDRRVSTRFFPSVEILSKEQYLPDQDVYVGVCPRETMKNERSRIRYITALWAGVDLGPNGYSGNETYFDGPSNAAKAVRSFPLPPSIIVESGNGMHLYWLFDDVMEITDPRWVEYQLRRINRYFQCRSEVKIDSVMRLPGTFNSRTTGRPRPCDVKYLNTDFRYTPEDFEAAKLATESDSALATHPASDPAPAQGTEGPPRHIIRGPDDEEIEDLTEELDEFLKTEPAKRQEYFEGSPGTAIKKEPTPRTLQESGVRRWSDDFEPLPYEPQGESKLAAKIASAESLDALADSIADRVVARLTDELAEKLVERVVTELVKKLHRK